MLCAICQYLWNLRNVKNTHGGVLLLVNLQTEVCNFTKSNTPPWVFFTFFKLYKWYQVAQRITITFSFNHNHGRTQNQLPGFSMEQKRNWKCSNMSEFVEDNERENNNFDITDFFVWEKNNNQPYLKHFCLSHCHFCFSTLMKGILCLP